MSESERAIVIDSMQWDETDLWWIECGTGADLNKRVSCEKWSSGRLQDWAAVADPVTSDGRHREVKLRIASCYGKLFGVSGLRLKRKDYSTLEECLGLHPSTLGVLVQRFGALEQFAEYTPESTGMIKRLKKLYLVMKPTGKYEVFSHGLSCVHDFDTGVTSAFLTGEFIGSNDMSMEEPKLRLDILQDLIARLETHAKDWSHPLLLPTLFYTLYLGRMNTYCSRSLMNNVMRLEDELRVTRVRTPCQHRELTGFLERHRFEDDPVLPKGLLAKDEAMRLTIRINTQMTRLLMAKVSPGWTKTAIACLLENLEDGRICPSSMDSRTIRERLRSNINQATFLENYLDSLQARLMLQVNVLSSFIAQSDNHYSARLAELSGRDSTSMKILAFITTIFLPGTFVATMFSMDMFSWSKKDEGDTRTVSGQFWIYWAVAVPLTLVTLAGWGVWWRIEGRRFGRSMENVVKDADTFNFRS